MRVVREKGYAVSIILNQVYATGADLFKESRPADDFNVSADVARLVIVQGAGAGHGAAVTRNGRDERSSETGIAAQKQNNIIECKVQNRRRTHRIHSPSTDFLKRLWKASWRLAPTAQGYLWY